MLDEVRDTFNFGEKEARNILGMFLFRGDDVFKTVGMLSGGEKARLSLLCLFLEKPNFLILDEPTNHLDIRSIEALQDVLRHCACALVLVSHDEQFLDALVDERWVFEVEQEKGEVGLGDTHVRVVR